MMVRISRVSNILAVALVAGTAFPAAAPQVPGGLLGLVSISSVSVFQFRRGLGQGPLGQRRQQRPNGQAPNGKGLQLLRQRIMREINLTPVQRQQIQQIRRNHDDQMIAGGRRVRQARLLLDQAIMSEHYDDAQVNRLAQQLARAQADQVLLRARIRAEVRQVLTTEQVTRFLEIQREIRRQQTEKRRMELEREDNQEQRAPSNQQDGQGNRFSPDNQAAGNEDQQAELDDPIGTLIDPLAKDEALFSDSGDDALLELLLPGPTIQ